MTKPMTTPVLTPMSTRRKPVSGIVTINNMAYELAKESGREPEMEYVEMSPSPSLRPLSALVSTGAYEVLPPPSPLTFTPLQAQLLTSSGKVKEGRRGEEGKGGQEGIGGVEEEAVYEVIPGDQ